MEKFNRDSILSLILSNDRAVERAMVVLYLRQTADEQEASDTKHTNRRGFSVSNASKGTYFARWVISGNRLSGHHLDRARKIAKIHVGQLVEEANIKASI